MNAWYETKLSCLVSVGRERSLVFGFSTLQREVLSIGSFGKLGTRSVLCDEKPKSGSSSVSYQDAILILRRLRVIIRENVYQDFLERARNNFRLARHPPRIRNQPVRVVSVIAVYVRSALLRPAIAQCWPHSRPKKC
jgi:hypothetical protein